MSFDFGNNNINQFKAQAAYKDGGGMGGGGMYMKQKKKRKEQPDEDLFEYKEEQEKDKDSLFFEPEIKEKDIPKDTVFNRFVNWFRMQQG